MTYSYDEIGKDLTNLILTFSLRWSKTSDNYGDGTLLDQYCRLPNIISIGVRTS